MTTPIPFEIEIFDKSFIRRGFIGDPIQVECIPRHNRVESLSVTVPSNHRRIGDLITRGARLVCSYRGEQVFSGPIRPISGAGPWMAGRVTFSCESDKRLLGRMLGYPVPGADINNQNAVQDKRTGPAETVLKGFVADNLAGDGVTPRWPPHQLITVAPDLGRGSSITAAVEMQPLVDVMVPLLDQAGIGFTVRQIPGNGNGLELDVYEPSVYPRTLSEEGRTVQSWVWNRTPPEATRAIVGGPVDDVTGLRPWLVAQAAFGFTETTWHDVIETMVDASSEENATARLSLGIAALSELAEKNGISVTLNDTTAFSFGGPNGVHVGDMITIDIGAQTITDILREAHIIWNHKTGFKATPAVGELTTPATRVATFLDRIARKLRALTIR